MDSIFNIEANSYVYIDNFSNLGNHPCELPTSPCSIPENDSLIVLIQGYNFNGDFRDEYNWQETLSSGYENFKFYNHKSCLFYVNNDQIVNE